MFKAILAALALALPALPALAQGVRLTLTDGSIVEGEFQGYENGRYRIVVQGRVREIEDRRVQDVSTGEMLPDETAVASAAPLDPAGAALEAFQSGQYDVALKNVSSAIQTLDRQRKDFQELVGKIYNAYLSQFVQTRDAARLGAALKDLGPTLSDASRRDICMRLAELFEEEFRISADDPFVAGFAEVLARNAGEDSVPDKLRTPVGDHLVQIAHRALENKNCSAAAAIYRGAAAIDPRRRETLKAKTLEAAVGAARNLLDGGDTRGAMEAAREAAALDPANAEIRRILEDADFAAVRRDVESAFGGEEAALLRDFLQRSQRPEHRSWATETLAKASSSPDPRSPAISAQMRKYFPVKPGRYMLYRRAVGDLRQRIKTDSVMNQDGVIKVFYTIEEIYKDWSSSKTHHLDIERDAIVMTAGEERDPILKFPLGEGAEWSWQLKNQEFRRTVRSMTDTVAVGTGSQQKEFKECLVVDFTSSMVRDGRTVSITSRSSYAPGVGLVKLEFLESSYQKYNLELIEHGSE